MSRTYRDYYTSTAIFESFSDYRARRKKSAKKIIDEQNQAAGLCEYSHSSPIQETFSNKAWYIEPELKYKALCKVANKGKPRSLERLRTFRIKGKASLHSRRTAAHYILYMNGRFSIPTAEYIRPRPPKQGEIAIVFEKWLKNQPKSVEKKVHQILCPLRIWYRYISNDHLGVRRSTYVQDVSDRVISEIDYTPQGVENFMLKKISRSAYRDPDQVKLIRKILKPYFEI